MTLCLALLAVGILMLFSHDDTVRGFAVLWFLLPAAIYILGWFYYMPELLGARRRSPRALHERWALWLRASGLLGLACLLGWGLFGIWELNQAWERSVAFALGTLAAYCVAVVMVLLRRHFAPEAGQAVSTQGATRRVWVEVFEKIGAPARHLANWLSPRVSLPSGSALILASVLLVTSLQAGCHDIPFRGHEVLRVRAAWLTAENMDHNASKAVSAVAAYANYCLGLVAALVIATLLVVRLRRKVSIQPLAARLLVFTTGAVVLFTISDLALFGPAQVGLIFYCLLLLLYWVAPMAAWLYYAFAGETRERWPAVRSSLIVLYLPVLFWSYGMLMFVAVLGVCGYVSYFLGVQLAWWGLIQLASAGANTGTSLSNVTVSNNSEEV